MTDIRERHVNGGPLESNERDVCEGCFGEWPCDAIREADRADAAEAALAGKYGFEAAGMVIAAQEERDAAEQDAKALAEALVRVRRVADDCWCGSNRLLIHTDDCLAARAALAAHRKATK